MVTSILLGVGVAPTNTTLPLMTPARLCSGRQRNTSRSAVKQLENGLSVNRRPCPSRNDLWRNIPIDESRLQCAMHSIAWVVEGKARHFELALNPRGGSDNVLVLNEDSSSVGAIDNQARATRWTGHEPLPARCAGASRGAYSRLRPYQALGR